MNEKTTLEIIAPTVEEAISQGLAQLGLTADAVSVEVLDTVNKGLFGLGKPQVRVRLTVVLPAAVHYIVIDDPLPAGLEAVDSTILTDTAVPTSYTLTDYEERGWGWWYFTHTELRDEKVVLSADYLPAGTYVFTYLARASTAGTFKVIPPIASEFYFPDVGGRGAGSVFEVKP